MKIRFIAVIGLLSSLTLSSCKKDWNCNCENIPFVGTISTEHLDKTRSEAREECDENQDIYHDNGLGSVDCSISSK